MITDSFDTSAPVTRPEDFLGEQRHLCDTCILVLSDVILHALKSRYSMQTVGRLGSVNGDRPIYLFDLDGKPVAATLCGVGATLAGNHIVGINWITGATKFILFGSAGSLNRAATTGKYVIPTEAYRDEGMSYHYAPPADYIKIGKADATAAIFEELRLPYVKGRVWTTDAFYRETHDLVAARQKDGCIAVEMELAGVQAVCDFHGFELYDFLVTGDVLDAPTYEVEGLHGANHDLDKLFIALEIAKRV